MASNLPSVSDGLLEQAARFRARLADAPGDTDLHVRVEQWKAVSPAHALAFDEAEKLWVLMGQPSSARPRPANEPRWGLRFAGLAVALAVVTMVPTLERTYQNLRSDAVAGIGRQSELALPDGSKVTLNSDTALAYNVDADGRSVHMFRGEAFFAVKHDPAHPFRIHAGDAEVTVLGTRFDVRMVKDDTQVTVEQGRVRLDGPGGSQILTAEIQGTAGQLSTLARAAYSADATAWRRGRAVFYDAALPQVITELNRYRTGAIHLANSDLRGRRITGSFRIGDPDETLAAIRASLGVKSLSLPGGVVLLY